MYSRNVENAAETLLEALDDLPIKDDFIKENIVARIREYVYACFEAHTNEYYHNPKGR